MKATCTVLSVAALGVALVLPAADQEAKKPAALPAAAEAMGVPKPGPEHEVLKSEEGTWDATVESFMAPGPPMVSKGVETNTLLAGCGW